MRIVIDARMYQESGVGRYIRNLITQLQILDHKNDYFILLMKRDQAIKLDRNFHKIIIDFRWYTLTEQLKLPKVLKVIKPHLVHFPHFNVPIFYRGRFVVTIHDLIHQRFAMKRATTLNPIIYQLKQFGYHNVLKYAIKQSERIFVPSLFVKELLKSNWVLNKEKIVITPEAVDDQLLELQKNITAEQMMIILKELQVQQPFIFYVGNAHPHKNIPGLIRAFMQISKKYPNLQLVLAGHDHYFWKEIKKKFQNQQIRYLGLITDEQLVALYKKATAFILPSFEEGFGIPVLEAMAASCPVICSDAGSLPEVASDAAIYFNPKDLSNMASQISRVLDDANLRQRLTIKGLKRVEQFSWQKLAQQTLKEYLACV